MRKSLNKVKNYISKTSKISFYDIKLNFYGPKVSPHGQNKSNNYKIMYVEL